QIEDREVAAAEQPSERAGAEIRAVLVVDIPERHLPQAPRDVGHLAGDDGAGTRRAHAPSRAYQLHRAWNVLQRHLAADEIGGGAGVLLRIDVRDEGRGLPALRCPVSARDVSGIEAE